MSTHVVGFIPPDEKWLKMRAIFDACKAANVGLPEEVDEFFGGETPDDRGREVDERAMVKAGAIREWKDDSREGFELDVSKLPPDVKFVRFYNSW